MRKVNVAVAVFHNIDRLGRAVKELLGLGLSTDQVNVLARSGALDGRLPEAADVHRELMRIAGAAATSETPRSPGEGGDQAVHLEECVPEGYVSGLRRHLEEGGCVVSVETRDDELARKVCETLLRHSVDSVQFHEFTRPS